MALAYFPKKISLKRETIYLQNSSDKYLKCYGSMIDQRFWKKTNYL